MGLALALLALYVISAVMWIPERTGDLWRSRSTVVGLTLGLFVMFLAVGGLIWRDLPRWGSPRLTHLVALTGEKIVFDWVQFVVACAGVVLIWASYLRKESFVEQLFRRELEGKTPAWEALRVILFDAAILGPLIIAVAIVAEGRLAVLRGIVYGLFVYSGFIVWSLSIRVVEGFELQRRGMWALVCVFVGALVVSVGWVAIIGFVASIAGDEVAKVLLGSVLNVAIGVILIQRVYGHLYRNTWGSALSDQWPGERPNYVIAGIVLGVLGAAVPQGSAWKLAVVGGILGVLLIVPAYRLSRGVGAYVLIRVSPGGAELIQGRLQERGIAATVVSGSYDLVCRVEARRTEEPLALLARKVRDEIRRIDGIRETETLIDFSPIALFRGTVRE